MDEEISTFLQSLEKDRSRVLDKITLDEDEDEGPEEEVLYEDPTNFNLVSEAMEIIGHKMDQEQQLPSHIDIEKYIDLVLDRSVEGLNMSETADTSGAQDLFSVRRKKKVSKKKMRSSILQSVLRSTPTKKKNRREVEEIKLPEISEKSKEEVRILKTLISQQPSDPIDAVLFYLKVIGNFPNRIHVRLEACKQIYRLWKENQDEMGQYSQTIAGELVNHCFKNFRNQTEEMNEYVVRVVGEIRHEELVSFLPSLIHLLKIPSRFALKETILNVLMKMGQKSFISLLKECEGPSSEWDGLILTILANHPFCLRYVVVPALIKECESKSMSRRLEAVRSLFCLGQWGQFALPKLCEMFEGGLLDRRTIATTIRRLGPEGERILMSCLTSNWNTRVRSCSAYALGEDIAVNDLFSDLVILVHAGPDAGIYFSKRRSVLKYCDEGFLVFDARELIVQIKRVLNQLDPEALKEPTKEDEETEKMLEEERRKLKEFKSLGDEVELDPESGGGGGGALKQQREDDDDDLFSIPYTCPVNIEEYITNLFEHCRSSTIHTFFQKKLFDPQKPLKTPTELLEKPQPIMKFNPKHFNNRFFRKRAKPQYHSEMEVVAALNEAIDDPEEKVRFETAKTIGVASHPSSLNALLKHLQDTSILVRGEAIHSLSYLASVVNGPRMIKKTLRCLTGLLQDKMYNVRYVTCRTIRAWSENFKRCTDSSHLRECLNILKKAHQDGAINRNCVCRTACTLGPLGIDYLCTVVSKETSYNAKLRMSAAVGLRFLDVERCGGQVVIDKVVETLFASSSDRIRNVRNEVLETLIVLSKKCENQPYLQNTSLLPFFYSFLKDRDDKVRATAAKNLAEMGEQGELVLLESVLKDPSDLVRAAAALGVGVLGPRNFLVFCQCLRKERSILVKREVVSVMKEIGWKNFVSWVLEKESKSFVKKVLEEMNRVLKIQEIPLFFTIKRRIIEKL